MCFELIPTSLERSNKLTAACMPKVSSTGQPVITLQSVRSYRGSLSRPQGVQVSASNSQQGHLVLYVSCNWLSAFAVFEMTHITLELRHQMIPISRLLEPFGVLFFHLIIRHQVLGFCFLIENRKVVSFRLFITCPVPRPFTCARTHSTQTAKICANNSVKLGHCPGT